MGRSPLRDRDEGRFARLDLESCATRLLAGAPQHAIHVPPLDLDALACDINNVVAMAVQINVFHSSEEAQQLLLKLNRAGAGSPLHLVIEILSGDTGVGTFNGGRP